MSTGTTSTKKPSTQLPMHILIVIIAVSIIVSGITGGLVGYVAGKTGQTTQESISAWGWLLGKNQPPQQCSSCSSVIQESILEVESATVAAVQQATQSVVSIVVTKEVRSNQYTVPDNFFFPFEDFFGFPFEAPAPETEESEPLYQQVGGGTGFVIDAQAGLILTNRHVVEDESATYTVITNDGEEFEATVLARDPFNDLAVVKVAQLSGVVELSLGDSNSLKLGQTVIAIGNSLGEFSNTVTTGVVSGIGRDIVAGSFGTTERLENVIQTDAAINPGNSGGPLIDLQGNVIGINTAVSQQGQLIGFAIPINEAKLVVESVKEFGRIVRPYLGVRYTAVPEEIAQERGLEKGVGSLIVSGTNAMEPAIIPDSPAANAGLVEGDIILRVSGKEVNEDQSLAYLVQQYQAGDMVELEVVHEDGSQKKISVLLKEFNE